MGLPALSSTRTSSFRLSGGWGIPTSGPGELPGHSDCESRRVPETDSGRIQSLKTPPLELGRTQGKPMQEIVASASDFERINDRYGDFARGVSAGAQRAIAPALAGLESICWLQRFGFSVAVLTFRALALRCGKRLQARLVPEH